MRQRKDRLLAIVLAVLCIAGLFLTGEFPKEASYYPRGILSLILLLCVVLFVQAKPEQTIDINTVLLEFITKRTLLYVILAIVTLVALMKPIGLYLELPFFTAFIMYIMGYRNKTYLILIPLALTLVVFLLFSLLLRVQVPMGLLKI
jgi:hypothetical protein